MPIDGRKHVPKKVVQKLKPGTFVRIMWLDAPDEVVMLIKQPGKGKGEIDLDYMKSSGELSSHATNEQVVEILSHLSWEAEHEIRNNDEDYFCAIAKLKYPHGTAQEILLW